MDKDTLVKVRNRDSGAVLYSIPEMNGLLRTFQPKEVKEVPFEELKKLSYPRIGKDCRTELFYTQPHLPFNEISG